MSYVLSDQTAPSAAREFVTGLRPTAYITLLNPERLESHTRAIPDLGAPRFTVSEPKVWAQGMGRGIEHRHGSSMVGISIEL